MWRDEGIVIPEGYGLVGRIVNKDPGIQQGDFGQACFNIDIDNIPTSNPGYVKVRWIDDTTYPHGVLCEYLPGYHHTPEFLEFEIGKTYRVWMQAVDSEQQGYQDAIPLPGVFWQWSTIGNDGDSGESSHAVQTYFDKDLSFAISSGTYEQIENGDDDPPIDDTPPITENAGAVAPVFLGAILFAFGITILIDESGFFNQFAGGYVFYYVWASLIIIWTLVFTAIFYFANNQTFWWEWLF